MLGSETMLRWLWERKFHGMKVSQEREFQGAKYPDF